MRATPDKLLEKNETKCLYSDDDFSRFGTPYLDLFYQARDIQNLAARSRDELDLSDFSEEFWSRTRQIVTSSILLSAVSLGITSATLTQLALPRGWAFVAIPASFLIVMVFFALRQLKLSRITSQMNNAAVRRIFKNHPHLKNFVEEYNKASRSEKVRMNDKLQIEVKRLMKVEFENHKTRQSEIDEKLSKMLQQPVVINTNESDSTATPQLQDVVAKNQ